MVHEGRGVLRHPRPKPKKNPLSRFINFVTPSSGSAKHVHFPDDEHLIRLDHFDNDDNYELNNNSDVETEYPGHKSELQDEESGQYKYKWDAPKNPDRFDSSDTDDDNYFPKTSDEKEEAEGEQGGSSSLLGEKEEEFKDNVETKGHPSTSYFRTEEKSEDEVDEDTDYETNFTSPEKNSSSSEKNFSSPEKKLSSEKNFSSPEKIFSSPEKNSSSSEKNFSSPEKHIRSPQKTFSPQKNFSSPVKNLRSPEKKFPSPEKKFDSPEKNFGSPVKNLRSPEKKFPSPEKKFASPEKIFSSPRKNLSPEKNIGSPVKNFGSPKKSYTSPEKNFNSPQKKNLSSPEKLFTSPVKEKVSQFHVTPNDAGLFEYFEPGIEYKPEEKEEPKVESLHEYSDFETLYTEEKLGGNLNRSEDAMENIVNVEPCDNYRDERVKESIMIMEMLDFEPLYPMEPLKTDGNNFYNGSTEIRLETSEFFKGSREIGVDKMEFLTSDPYQRIGIKDERESQTVPEVKMEEEIEIIKTEPRDTTLQVVAPILDLPKIEISGVEQRTEEWIQERQQRSEILMDILEKRSKEGLGKEVGNLKRPQNLSENNLDGQELLQWINDLMNSKIRNIEELGSGIIYCLLMNRFFLGSIDLNQVNFRARMEASYIQNFSILQDSFRKLGIHMEIPVYKLAKCRLSDNFEFIRWFKKFFESSYKGNRRHSRLHIQRTRPSKVPRAKKIVDVSQASGKPNTRAHDPSPSCFRPVSQLARPFTVKGAKKQHLLCQLSDLRLRMTIGKMERDSYAKKLSQIESLVSREKSKTKITRDLDTIMEILHIPQAVETFLTQNLKLTQTGKENDEIWSRQMETIKTQA